MKNIPVKNGNSALVDDDDLLYLSQFVWYSSNGYAYRNITANGKNHRYYMHWDVIGRPNKGLETDHVNRNRADNRRENLRHCTSSENKKNVGIRKDNKSGVTGVKFHKITEKWESGKKVNGKYQYIGLFSTIEEARKSLF